MDTRQRTWLHGTPTIRSTTLIRQKLKKRGLTTVSSLIIFISALIATICWIDVSIFPAASSQKSLTPSETHITLHCSSQNTTQTCPETHLTTHEPHYSSPKACPEYFRWIHEDLKPWKTKGISKEMVESGKNSAHIRLVVVNGKVYMEKYKKVYQTRDLFTVWGILQLLKLYPGKLPDLDFIFECGDKPVVKKSDYMGDNVTKAPPMFHYCGDDSTLDMVFPDWSFWGWPEVNIKPWDSLKKELEEGNHMTKWSEREPYAYWKGSIRVSKGRKELIICNVTDKQDWNARLYDLAWVQESRQGFKHTNLASQCTHRYKIYAEGVAWSVSEKYIIACDSMTLIMKPQYYDFFTRSLIPTIHYWPVNENDKCRSIKLAVDWGNNHPKKAQEIGKRGSQFIQEELNMHHVYDYMFHLLTEYAKLLKYKPTVPIGAIEVCSETLACKAKVFEMECMIESMVKNPSNTRVCTMPPPYHDSDLQSVLERKKSLSNKVKIWEASGNVVGVQL